MSDLLKGLSGGGWVSLYAWMFPSALFMGALWLLVYPDVRAQLTDYAVVAALRSLDATGRGVALALFTAALGLGLNAISTPLYRVLEGYSWPRRCRTWSTQRQLNKKKDIKDRVDHPDKIVGQRWEHGLLLDRLALFPRDDAQVAPTRLGNALRAFETYGKSRYNLDSQTLWVELCAAAPAYLQQELDRSRAIVDFFVALLYLSGAFGLCTWTAEAIGGAFSYKLTVIGALSLLSAFVWYRMAVVSSSYWRVTVQALVNVGRKGLADALGLRIPGRLDDERRMWGLVTRFVYSGYDATKSSALNEFRTEPADATPASPPWP